MSAITYILYRGSAIDKHLFSLLQECHCWLPIFSIARVPLLIAYFLYCGSVIIYCLFSILYFPPIFIFAGGSLLTAYFLYCRFVIAHDNFLLQEFNCWLPFVLYCSCAIDVCSFFIWFFVLYCSSVIVHCHFFSIAGKPLWLSFVLYFISVIVHCPLFSIAGEPLWLSFVLYCISAIVHCPLFSIAGVPLFIVLCSLLQVCHCSLPFYHQWSALMLITESMTYVHLGKT